MGIVFLSNDGKVWKLHEYNGGIVNALNANKSITVEKLLCCMNLSSAATSRTKFKHIIFQKNRRSKENNKWEESPDADENDDVAWATAAEDRWQTSG